MRHKLQTCIVILSGCLLLAGCAPEFGLDMKVPSLPDPSGISDGGAEAASLRVRIGAFSDARPSSTIAVIDGREIPAQGSLSLVVQEAFQRYFHDAGMKVVMLDAPIVSGEILEWKARISPGFPVSEATASAKIRVELKDSQRHMLFRGVFTGEATGSHPLLDEEKVQQLLGLAMAGAIERAVREGGIQSRLSQGRIE